MNRKQQIKLSIPEYIIDFMENDYTHQSLFDAAMKNMPRRSTIQKYLFAKKAWKRCKHIGLTLNVTVKQRCVIKKLIKKIDLYYSETIMWLIYDYFDRTLEKKLN